MKWAVLVPTRFKSMAAASAAARHVREKER